MNYNIVKKMKKIIVFLLFLLSVPCLFAEISFALVQNYTNSLGTTLENDKFNNEINQFEDLGFSSKNITLHNFSVNTFVRWNFSKLQNLGIEFDLSYFNKNGTKFKFQTTNTKITYEYFYPSIDFAPLVTYNLIPKPNLNITFLIGPNFSIPLDKLHQTITIDEKTSTELEIVHTLIPGMQTGFSIGYLFNNFELFFITKYVLDFTPVAFTSNNQEEDLLTRRCLSAGFGVRYLMK